jgi:hypothetical protein
MEDFMRKLAAVCGFSVLGLFATVAPAFANGDGDSNPPPTICNSTLTGATVHNNVEVPVNGICVINNSVIDGGVTVDQGGYFESNHSNIGGDVLGNAALTLYVHDHSYIGGNVVAYQTPQLFLYDSTVKENAAGYGAVSPGFGHFQVCGNNIGKSIGLSKFGPDILIGDPAGGCAGNKLGQDIWVVQNTTSSELTVRGNTLANGGLHVVNNNGSSAKFVQNNKLPNGTLECSGNTSPFTGSPNGAHASTKGTQCA